MVTGVLEVVVVELEVVVVELEVVVECADPPDEKAARRLWPGCWGALSQAFTGSDTTSAWPQRKEKVEHGDRQVMHRIHQQVHGVFAPVDAHVEGEDPLDRHAVQQPAIAVRKGALDDRSADSALQKRPEIF